MRSGAHRFPCFREQFPDYRFLVTQARPSRGRAVPNMRATPQVAQDVPAPTNVRCVEAAVRDAYPKHPLMQFPVAHAPHNEVRLDDRRVEQIRLSPEVPVLHEVRGHDDVGFPIPVDAANRVEQL